MLCPKCNFTTFEHAEVCKRCGYDLKAFRESKGIKTLKPAIKSPSPSPLPRGEREYVVPLPRGEREYVAPLPQGEDEVRGTGLEKSSRAEQEELTKSPKEAIISEVTDEPQKQAEANNQPMPYNESSKGVGSENPLERRKQNMQQAGTSSGSQEGSPVAGFFILIAAFFSMPIKTLKITIQELREVSNKGKLDVAATDIPHLTWLHVAGHLFISIAVVVIVVLGILLGLYSLKDIRYSTTGAIGGLVLYPVGGAFAAILADWFMAIGLELLGLWAGMANDIKKISQR